MDELYILWNYESLLLFWNIHYWCKHFSRDNIDLLELASTSNTMLGKANMSSLYHFFLSLIVNQTLCLFKHALVHSWTYQYYSNVDKVSLTWKWWFIKSDSAEAWTWVLLLISQVPAKLGHATPNMSKHLLCVYPQV